MSLSRRGFIGSLIGAASAIVVVPVIMELPAATMPVTTLAPVAFRKDAFTVVGRSLPLQEAYNDSLSHTLDSVRYSMVGSFLE
jgi:hypothetical protein